MQERDACGIFTDRGIYYLLKLESKPRVIRLQCLDIFVPGKDGRITYKCLLNGFIESHPYLAGKSKCISLHLSCSTLNIAKLEELSSPKQSEPRPTSKDKFSKIARRTSRASSITKSNKKPRDSSGKTTFQVK